MKNINAKLNRLAANIASGKALKIMIFGLGSVGCYLLDYLMTWPETNIEIHICGRNPEKVASDINIIRVANIIRHGFAKITIFHQIDLNNIDEITEVINKVEPDFIVNSSRAYSGLKYGSISWINIRAYGLWSPLAVKFIRNIMNAYKRAGCEGVVINTSYSDVVNPWLKSAGLPYPDFGSGNFNHLIPRIKLAVAELMNISDIAAINVVLATSHFHDVVISKEGQTEGLEPLVHLSYKGQELHFDMCEIYKRCAIAMPSDAKRNMMNASSNFDIINSIVDSIRLCSTRVIHTPGIAGNIGGYPVRINFRRESLPENRITFIEDHFSYEEMEAHNRRSIFLDGIEDISGGVLTYTDELQKKVMLSFGVNIPKYIPFDAIDDTANFLIEKIIKRAL